MDEKIKILRETRDQLQTELECLCQQFLEGDQVIPEEIKEIKAFHTFVRADNLKAIADVSRMLLHVSLTIERLETSGTQH